MRSMLLIAYDSNDLSDEDFLVLYNSYQSRNPEFPFAIYGRLSPDSFDKAECLAMFRFRKQDIPLLAQVLTFAKSNTRTTLTSVFVVDSMTDVLGTM